MNDIDGAGDEDVFDAVDVLVERLVETLEDDESAMDDLLRRCGSDNEDDMWTQVCSIITADRDDEQRDDGDHDD